MTSITVTEEQALIIKSTANSIEVRGPKGEWLGVLRHVDEETEEDIRIALKRRASGGPYYTTAEVLAHLQSLESEQ